LIYIERALDRIRSPEWAKSKGRESVVGKKAVLEVRELLPYLAIWRVSSNYAE
jgi:hypothetical protein